MLAALWAAERPLTASEVVDAVDADLAYNTVQTILARLYAKGAVARQQAGRAHAYLPVLDDAGRLAHRMRAVLDAGQDHTAVLTQFLGTLTADEESVLVGLLKGKRRRGGAR